MGFHKIPPELLLLVAEYLSLKDLSSFHSACYWAWKVLTPLFQKRCLRVNGILTSLQWAAVRGYTELIELALFNGAEINVPLMVKLSRAHLGVSSKLYAEDSRHPCSVANSPDYPYDTIAKKRTPLFLAACCGHANAIKVLLDHGASMQGPTGIMTTVHAAASRGDVPCMQAFIRPGFDIYARGAKESTVLHYAVTGGVEMMRYILQLDGGRNLVNARTSEGFTPLHSLTGINCTGQKLKMELLLQYGADIYSRDNYGNTVAHHFVMGGNSECLQVLIDAGFHLPTRGTVGRTILHTAIYSGKKIVKYILGIEGGDKLIDIKDDFRLTALDYTSRNGNLSKIKRMLEYRQVHRRTKKRKWRRLEGKSTT